VLKAGFGKISITPSVGSPLAGFAAREGVCEGIHDELHSRALVLENEAIAVIIISLDVLAVSEALSNAYGTGSKAGWELTPVLS